MGNVITHNSRTDRHRVFIFRGKAGHMTRHVWQLFKDKKSKVKVTRSRAVSADKDAITRQCMVISTKNVAKSPKFCTLIGNRGRRIEQQCLNLHRKFINNRFCACAVQMLLKMAVNTTKCSTFEVQISISFFWDLTDPIVSLATSSRTVLVPFQRSSGVTSFCAASNAVNLLVTSAANCTALSSLSSWVKGANSQKLS